MLYLVSTFPDLSIDCLISVMHLTLSLLPLLLFMLVCKSVLPDHRTKERETERKKREKKERKRERKGR